MRSSPLLAALALGFIGSAQAASILIDDRDVNTITITATGFDGEGGFRLNGTPLGNGVPTILNDADGGWSFSGSWIPAGGDFPNVPVSISFSESSFPNGITSGIDVFALLLGSDGPLQNIAPGYMIGVFAAYTGLVYTTGPSPFDQNGGSRSNSDIPSLTVTFIPEPTGSVPDGGNTGLLLGLTTGLLGMVARRLRR